MKNKISSIYSTLKENIKQEGLFWRIARPDTFVDLLMLQAGKASKHGIDDKLAIEVVLIAVKAIINGKLGVKDFTTDYEQLNKELFDEQNLILNEIEGIISYGLLKSETKVNPLPVSDDLNYFKVLNNLELENYSLEVFERILETFLSYIKSKD